MTWRTIVIVCVVAVCLIAHPSAAIGGSSFTLPDTALVWEFSKEYGPASFTRTDVAGPGVRYDFSALAAQATGVGDNYMVAGVYGQILPSHGNGDFSNFDSYTASVTNLNGSGTVSVSLILNTGFTGPSGVPPNNPANDTFWQSDWVDVPAGQTRTLVLHFDNAVAYNISDNPVPHTEGGNGSPDGNYYAINVTDRTEVSNIGFQIADFHGGASSASIIVAPPVEAPLLQEGSLLVGACALLALGAALLVTAGGRAMTRHEK